MNTKAIKSLLMMGIITTFGLLTITESKAQRRMQFICNTNGKFPTTVAFTNPQERIYIIEWTKKLGSHSPQDQCRKFTPLLQEIYNEGNVGLITNGKMNGKDVICVVNEYGGRCKTKLLDLRPGDNSLEIANKLKEIIFARQVGPIKNSAGSPQIYYKINFDLWGNSSRDK